MLIFFPISFRIGQTSLVALTEPIFALSSLKYRKPQVKHGKHFRESHDIQKTFWRQHWVSNYWNFYYKANAIDAMAWHRSIFLFYAPVFSQNVSYGRFLEVTVWNFNTKLVKKQKHKKKLYRILLHKGFYPIVCL